VHAYEADKAGNLAYRYTARNFNPVVAQCSKFTVAEAEIIRNDFIDPNHVVTPGIFVQALVKSVPREKPIEQRTVRAKEQN
jgi:3-oxoacid CoA-transferase subunit A